MNPNEVPNEVVVQLGVLEWLVQGLGLVKQGYGFLHQKVSSVGAQYTWPPMAVDVVTAVVSGIIGLLVLWFIFWLFGVITGRNQIRGLKTRLSELESKLEKSSGEQFFALFSRAMERHLDDNEAEDEAFTAVLGELIGQAKKKFFADIPYGINEKLKTRLGQALMEMVDRRESLVDPKDVDRFVADRRTKSLETPSSDLTNAVDKRVKTDALAAIADLRGHFGSQDLAALFEKRKAAVLNERDIQVAADALLKSEWEAWLKSLKGERRGLLMEVIMPACREWLETAIKEFRSRNMHEITGIETRVLLENLPPSIELALQGLQPRFNQVVTDGVRDRIGELVKALASDSDNGKKDALTHQVESMIDSAITDGLRNVRPVAELAATNRLLLDLPSATAGATARKAAGPRVGAFVNGEDGK